MSQLQFKVRNRIAPEITTVFKLKDYLYDLRNNKSIQKRNVKSCACGSEAVSDLRLKLWDILFENIKNSEDVQDRKDLLCYMLAVIAT